MIKGRFLLSPMPSLGQPNLQVIPAPSVLDHSVPVAAPALIIQIDSVETAQQLVAVLQTQLPTETVITWVFGAASQDLPLAQNLSLDSWEYPCSVYIPPIYSQTLEALQGLIEVVAKLRSPQGGCPWDLAQTPQSLIPYVIEEAYEVVDAIQQGESAAIAEELGDLLLQVVLQAQIASDQATFSLTEVAQKISEKLIRRHPHVFGDLKVESVAQIHQNWEQIKATEQGEAPLHQKLRHYARSLPPLMAGYKISQKAAATGLEWEDISGVWAKFYEELAELQEALEGNNPAHKQAELGDLLFTVVNLARWSHLDPGEALRETNHRFTQRLKQMEEASDQPLSAYSLAELEARWQQAKLQLNQA